MGWKTEKYCNVVSGDYETVWNILVHRGLGLPNNLAFLPYFPSESTHNHIYQGMKTKIVGSAGTVNIVTVSKWLPDQRQLKLSIHSNDDPNRRQWQHLQFSVDPNSNSDESKICLTIETSTSIDIGQVIRFSKTQSWGGKLLYWSGLIFNWAKKNDYNYAEGVLHPIVWQHFTKF